MKKAMLLAGLVLVGSLAVAPVAFAADAPPPAPSCSQALDQLATARAMPVGDVTTKLILLGEAKAAQITLDQAVVAAQKAFDTNTNADPVHIAALQVALNQAKADAAAGQAKVDAAQKALDADKKLASDRDAAIAAAQVVVDKSCKGDPGTTQTVTPTPTTSPVPVPVMVTVPNAINTGWAA